MQKKSLIKSLAASFSFVIILSGCSSVPAPDKTAEEVLNSGFTSFVDVSSYAYNVSFDGDIKSPDGENVNFDLNLDGQVDLLDKKDPKFVVKFDGKGSNGGPNSGSVKAELRMNKDNVYVSLLNLDVKGDGAEMIVSEVKDILGKWYALPLTEDDLAQLSVAFDSSSKGDVKDMLDGMKLFTNAKYVGSDNIMGEPSYHYSIAFDKKALLDFAKASAAANGETVSDEKLAEANKALDAVDLNVDIWVGTQSGIVTKFKGALKLKKTADQPEGSINFEFSVGDINKPVTIQVPSGVQQLTQDDLALPMMMMGLGGPSMMNDSSFGSDMEGMGDVPEMSDEEIEAMMKDLDM